MLTQILPTEITPDYPSCTSHDAIAIEAALGDPTSDEMFAELNQFNEANYLSDLSDLAHQINEDLALRERGQNDEELQHKIQQLQTRMERSLKHAATIYTNLVDELFTLPIAV